MPHRWLIFTFPEVLHAFFRHHRAIYGELAHQTYAIIKKFYLLAEELARFNAHPEAIVLALWVRS